MGWTVDAHQLPGASDTKLVASVPYLFGSYSDRINSFGQGTITLPASYPRLSEILDPVNDTGSLLWLKRDGAATDLAFFARRWTEDTGSDVDTVTITGPGVGDALLQTVVEPYGTAGALDWIWGGANVLSNPGFEDSSDISETYSLWNDASSGTYTLTVDAQTTGNIDFNDIAADVEIALEALSTVTDCTVEGAGTEADPWSIVFVDPAFPAATMTVTDTLTGGDSTLEQTNAGSVDPSPWTKITNVRRGAPRTIATYSSDGWQPDTTNVLAGTYSWRVNGLARYAGHQQLVRVTPGQTYQAKAPVWTTDGADEFRLVIRTPFEVLIDSSTWPSDTVSGTSVWDETTFAIVDVVIPDDITEVVWRFAYVGLGNPDPYYTDGCELVEGLVPTSAGGIMDTLLDAAQVKGSLSWLVWNFTASVDSNGTSWSDTALSFVATHGENLGQVLVNLAQHGIEYHIFWNGSAWELGLYEPYNLSTYADGLGTDRSADDSPSVILGRGVESGPIQINEPAYTVIYAEGANGLWSTKTDATAITNWGRREGYVTDFGVDDQTTLDALAQSSLDTSLLISGDKLRLDAQSHQPYGTISLGDTVQVVLPPRVAKTARRFVGIVTRLPVAVAPSPVWEIDLDKASYGSATSVAEGLRRVLTRFDQQPAIKSSGDGIYVGLGGGSVPTVLVAASDARDEIKENADFVCSGSDDQTQINAAIATAGAIPFGARVVLSEGQFNVSGMVTNAAQSGIHLMGMGFHSTRISMQENGYTDAYVVDMNNISQISDFQVYIVSTATGLTAAVRLDGVADRVEVEMYNDETFNILMLLENNVSWVSNSSFFYSSTTTAASVIGIKAATAAGSSEMKLFNNHISNLSTGILVESENALVLGNSVRDTDLGYNITGDGARVVANHALYTDPSFGPTGALKGFQVDGADDVILSANMVTGSIPVGSTLSGLYLTGSIGNLTQRANHWNAVTIPVDDQATTLSLIEDLEVQAWSDDSATLATTTGAQPWIWSGAGTVVDVRAVVGTAPTGADILVDVNVNGSSLWSTGQPTITATTKDSGITVPDQNATLADGDVLTVDIDQIGSTIAGGNLTVVVRIRERF